MTVQEFFSVRKRYLILPLVVIATIAAVIFWLVLAVLRPMPPRVVVMATGPQGGAYVEWGTRYRNILAREGVELRLLPTAGSVENLAMLRDPRSGVTVGFVQAGLITEADSTDLISLGTISYEPLWLFYRSILREEGPRDLRGKRLSIGPEGSGTRALLLRILELNGISERDVELSAHMPEQAKEKLLKGEIDIAAMVSSWESPVVQQLLSNQSIGLVSFPRTSAYIALYPFLSKVVVPTGVADLAKNLPPEDVALLAPKASIVARKDLHPALQYLFLEAASVIHSGPGFFQKAGQFPAPEGIDIPLSAYARHFFKSGAPFLQRYLPFWLAVLVERLLILLIPLVGVIYPLVRYVPEIYEWGMRRRIFRLYGELKLFEVQLTEHSAGRSLGDLLSHLDQIEARVGQLHVPVTFMPMLYTLRQHINMDRERLKKLWGNDGSDSSIDEEETAGSREMHRDDYRNSD